MTDLTTRPSTKQTPPQTESCRFALMTTADAAGQVIDPGPASTWAYVESNTLKVLRNCIGREKEGGLVLIAGMPSPLKSPVLPLPTRI